LNALCGFVGTQWVNFDAIQLRYEEKSFYLPHFNPDLEPTEPPPVTDLRAQIKWADGLLISSPEYAHGVQGVLKNALDWLVSGEEFVGKAIALINASPRGTHAQAALTEIMTTMSGQIVPKASITLALLGKNLDADGILSDPKLSGDLKTAIIAFANAIKPTWDTP
jgi:chromate reductase, NAD(P)H dehydrogenase (quinone)